MVTGNLPNPPFIRTAKIDHLTGFTRLTGDGSGYVDTTNVYGGTLAIENMLGGMVNVMPGGALGGSGTANGNVTFSDGAFYLVELDGTTDPQTDAFTETGGVAALSSPSQTTSTTFTTLGLRLAAELARNVSTRGMVGWRHAFGDVDPSSVFTIAGSMPFTILGAPIAEDAAVVEAGLDVQASPNVNIGVSYIGQYGEGAIANGVSARMVAKF